MVYLIIIVLVGIGIIVIVSFSRKKNEECFSQENFDKVIDYTKWKQKTSKIGKVLISPYRVEVSLENELLFKNDKKGNLIFKVIRINGIVIPEAGKSDALKRKANNAFCELLKRALFHPINPK